MVGMRSGRLIGKAQRRTSGYLSVALAAAIAALSAAPACAETTVRYVEVVRNLAYLPSYIAIARGFLKQEGIDVDLSTAQGGDKATAQILSGHADITLVGPETAVYVQNSASPDKMLIFCSLTGTSTNFLVSRQKIRPADFRWSMVKGKTVIGWRPGSTPELFLEWALKKHGIDPAKDITDVTNIGVPARLGAWFSGKGDYAIFSEPELTRIETMGKGVPVVSIGLEVGPVDYTVFMATDSYIKKHPKVVQGWTNAIYRAQLLTARADADDLARSVMQYFPGITQQQIAAAIDRYRKMKLWPADPVVYPKAVATLQDILIAGGVQKPDKRVKYESIVDRHFADRAKSTVEPPPAR